jgi:hypothetical protein
MYDFEWDPEKARQNRHKHGVDFQDAILVFLDPNRIEDDDWYPREQRWRTIGMVNDIVILVVFTYRKTRIRMISARKATKNETQRYHHPTARP